MRRARQCHTTPNKDLQLLLQFGIRKKVQIRLVKLKVEVNKRPTKLKSKIVKSKLKPKSYRNKQTKIQIPVQNRRHSETEEITKKFKCQLCNYSGAKLNNLKSHLRINSDERPFKCTLCSYKGLTRNYLNKHLLTHQGKKSYTCLFCAKRFSRTSNKSTHEIKCRKNPKHSDAKWLDENKRHKCHLCKFVSWDAGNLRVHLKRHLGQKPFPCNLCTYKSSTQGNLNSHIFTHTREKPFKCLECDYSASLVGNLKRHTKWRHSNEIRNKNFPCNLCPKKYYAKPHLFTHILSHTGETPFACQFCERGFNVNTNKNQHEQICRKNPKQKDKKWVENQKVFKCELCQYSCIQKGNLVKHLLSHAGSKPLKTKENSKFKPPF